MVEDVARQLVSVQVRKHTDTNTGSVAKEDLLRGNSKGTNIN